MGMTIGCIDPGIIQHQVTYATFCNMQQASKGLHTISDVAKSYFRSGATDTDVAKSYFRSGSSDTEV
jgi:predicted RNA-binding protein with RPS1 domain